MAGNGNKPSLGRNILGRIGDRLAWGNNYNSQTGQFSATPGQWAGGILSTVGNVLYPGSGRVATTIYNGTQGQGPLGRIFNGNSGNFQGNPVTARTFNPQFGINGAGPAGTTLQTVDPATGIPFTLPSMNPTQRFNPNNGNGAQGGNSFLGGNRSPNMGGGIGGLTGVASQMGGARGAFGGGGITGDAARALFASMVSGPMSFSTYNQQAHNQ